MPDAGASRKRQIPGCLIQEPSSDTWTPDRGSPLYPEAGATHCYTRVANASRMSKPSLGKSFPCRFVLPFRGCSGACNRNSRSEDVGPIRKTIAAQDSSGPRARRRYRLFPALVEMELWPRKIRASAISSALMRNPGRCDDAVRLMTNRSFFSIELHASDLARRDLIAEAAALLR